jgi:transposase
MAEVLCVYRQVKILKETAAASKKKSSNAVAIISYDEKPGIQAVATTAPDLPPEPGVHAAFARDHEYKRLGTVSLLAGIDLVTGQVHALVKDRHRSREFVEFLQLLDAAYPTRTAIKLILDNHSAHISKETKAWLAQQPAGRFEFTFTPKHGSWLNLVEGFFSKLARSVLRHIRVASKQELKIASWLPWMTSTSIQSSILGPISLIKLHDYDSNHENAELVTAAVGTDSRRPAAPSA